MQVTSWFDAFVTGPPLGANSYQVTLSLPTGVGLNPTGTPQLTGIGAVTEPNNQLSSNIDIRGLNIVSVTASSPNEIVLSMEVFIWTNGSQYQSRFAWQASYNVA